MLTYDIIQDIKNDNMWNGIGYWKLMGYLLLIPFTISLDLLFLPLEIITYIIWKNI